MDAGTSVIRRYQSPRLTRGRGCVVLNQKWLICVHGLYPPTHCESRVGGVGCAAVMLPARAREESNLLPSLRAHTSRSGSGSRGGSDPTPTSEGTLPFSNTRLRAYSTRLDTIQGFATSGTGRDSGGRHGAMPAPMRDHDDRMTADDMAATFGGDADGVAALALEEIRALRGEISRVEGTLNVLKDQEGGASEVSTMGRRLPSAPPAMVKTRATRDVFAERRRRWEAAMARQSREPVSRGMATILKATLEEMLPEGSLRAQLVNKPGRGMGKGQIPARSMSAGNMVGVPPVPGLVEFDLHAFERDFELIDMVAREATRQVAATCNERGALLDTIRHRYHEFCSAMAAATARLQQSGNKHAVDLNEARKELERRGREIQRLSVECARLAVDAADQRERADDLDARLIEANGLAAATQRRLTEDGDLLAAEAAHLEDRLKRVEGEREAALQSAVGGLENELEELRTERDDLELRVRFLEQQLTKAMAERVRTVPVDHVHVQTEPETADVFEPEPEPEPEPSATEADAAQESARVDEPASGDAKDAEDAAPSRRASRVSKGGSAPGHLRRRRKHQLGGFAPHVASEKVGAKRAKTWVLQSLAQIYIEKIALDTPTTTGNHSFTTPLPEFVYEWHLKRYGLRKLAEANLMDLVSSARSYAKTSRKCRLFTLFCGLQDDPARRGGGPDLDFYLFTLRCISPNDIVKLFKEPLDPDEPRTAAADHRPGAGIFWMKPLEVQDVVLKCFPDLGESPSELRGFMQTRIEPLVNAKTHKFDADDIVDALLDAFHHLTERNMALLKGFFRKGAGGVGGDNDVCTTYDEFLECVRSAEPGRSVRDVNRMYREALAMSPDGESVDSDTFVRVAQKHGLQTAKVPETAPREADLNPLPIVKKGATSPVPGGLRAASPQLSATPTSGHHPLDVVDAESPLNIVGAPEARTAADAAREVAAATADVSATFEEIARDEEVDVAVANIFAQGLSAEDSAARREGASPSPAKPAPPVAKPVPEHLLDMLDAALADVDPLDEQIASLSDKLGEAHPSVVKARKQKVLFDKLLEKRKDAEGAWLAYRVLIGHLKTATVKYHRGLKFDEEENAAAERARKLREAEGTNYSSALLSYLAGGTGGEVGKTTEIAEGSALSMLRGNPGNAGKGRGDDLDEDD